MGLLNLLKNVVAPKPKAHEVFAQIIRDYGISGHSTAGRRNEMMGVKCEGLLFVDYRKIAPLLLAEMGVESRNLAADAALVFEELLSHYSETGQLFEQDLRSGMYTEGAMWDVVFINEEERPLFERVAIILRPTFEFEEMSDICDTHLYPHFRGAIFPSDVAARHHHI